MVEEKKISALIPDDHNFNVGTEYGQRLIEKSLSEFGAGRGILLDKNGRIIAGNKTVENAAAIGLEDVIIVPTDGTKIVATMRTDIDLDSERGRAMALADNATSAANLKWDATELQKAAEKWNVDATEWGVNLAENAEAFQRAEAEEDGFVEEDEAIETRCQKGDIWLLGSHRLMCGDSTKQEDVMKLMNGEQADLCFTDPPYGMKKAGIENDNLNFDALLEFNKLWIPLSFACLKSNGSWYCWGIDEPLMDIYSNILKPMLKSTGEDKITFRNLLTWNKGNGQGQLDPSRREYAIADEKCLFVMKGQQEYGRDLSTWYEGFEKFRQLWLDEVKKSGLKAKEVEKISGSTYASHYGSRSQFALVTEDAWNNMKQYCEENNIEAFRQDYEIIRQDWYSTRAYFDNTHCNMNNVWNIGRTAGKEREETGGHETPKPIELCARGIMSSSREGEKVLDLFGGSGSTLIACEQLNRICYMMEYAPHYCDVIIARWEKLTGATAIKLEEDKA